MKLTRIAPYTRHDTIEGNGGIQSSASMIVGIAERPTPQILAKHRPEGEPNLNIVGGENEFLDTADNRERVAVVAPTASYDYVQPNTSEWGAQNIAGIAHPKITRDITVFPNASYKITSMETFQ